MARQLHTLAMNPRPATEDALTVPRAKLDDDGYIEIGSSAFIDESAPPEVKRAAASLVGQMISGRYRVDEVIGQGGLGAVFGGEQVQLKRRVAIKVLRPDTERQPGFVERFEREAIAGAHVQHPNVAAAIDFGKLDDGSYFLVTEFVEGVPLSDLLKHGPLPPVRALVIARQMAEGLAAVHDKGIVHRDVKPQNTIIGPKDRVKIIDFGLAKVDVGAATGGKPGRGTPLTSLGVIFGTIAYLAPEAALGMAAVGERADLYALGVTLYEMLCGKRPFSASDQAALFHQQRTVDPPPMHVRAPEAPVPPAAAEVAMRLVQRDPAARTQTADEVIAAIDDALLALGATAPRLTFAPRISVPEARASSPSAIPRTIDEAAMASVLAARNPAPIPVVPRADAPPPEEEYAPASAHRRRAPREPSPRADGRRARRCRAGPRRRRGPRLERANRRRRGRRAGDLRAAHRHRSRRVPGAVRRARAREVAAPLVAPEIAEAGASPAARAVTQPPPPPHPSRKAELVREYDQGHTPRMKVTVSVPDPVFRGVERAAKRLGISRSELISRAAAAFVEEHRGREVTESYNRAYGPADPGSSVNMGGTPIPPPDTDGDRLREEAARRGLLEVEW